MLAVIRNEIVFALSSSCSIYAVAHRKEKHNIYRISYNKKLCYRRRTARRAMSVKILPTAETSYQSINLLGNNGPKATYKSQYTI